MGRKPTYEELERRVEKLKEEAAKRKEAEEALRESEQKYRTQFEEALDAIFIADAETGILIDCNHAAVELVGRPISELVSKHQRILHPSEEVGGVFSETFKEHLEGKEGQALESRVVTKDGEIKDVSIKANLFELKGKRVLQGIFRDISERKRAEKALREKEKRYKELWHDAPVAYHMLDTRGIIRRVNQTEADMLGYTRAEMVGKSIFEFIQPEQRKEAEERFLLKLAGKQVPKQHDRIYVAKDGAKIYVSIDDRLEFGTDGQVSGVRTTMVDITQQKRAEEKLRQSEDSYRRLSENLPGIVYRIFIREDNRMHFFNDMLEAMTGYKVEELKTGEVCSIEPFVIPEDRGYVVETVSRAIVEDEPFEVYYRFRHKDGNIRHFFERGRPMRGTDGSPLHIDGVILDVTEREQTQEALRESEEKYRNVVERSNDGIVIIQDGVIKYSNPTLAKMTGHDPDEAIDMPFTEYIYPSEVEEAIDHYRRRMAGESLPARYERGLRHKDGTRIDTEIDAAVITYKDKPAVLVIIRDITDRKLAEETLRKSSEQIKLFAYSVSHDLKSPAVGVHGLTKRLHEQYGHILDEKGRNYCKRILQASQQITALVGNINMYISTKEMPLRIEAVQLGELLQMVRDDYSGQFDVRQIRWLQPEDMPEVMADRLSILRIIRNLVDNALKHGGDELSQVGIGYEGSDEFHILSVSNDGVPISLEDPAKVFGPFQREDTSRSVEGTGLGLAIVKELAEEHGGMVRVESDSKRGTTFYIYISKSL
ncbi:MAG: PAS domain S-box protein [Thermodesulfobacteriota bacterium]|nr:PAS domain S-box protein [Thermodesulfobacteriota bacterium]